MFRSRCTLMFMDMFGYILLCIRGVYVSTLCAVCLLLPPPSVRIVCDPPQYSDTKVKKMEKDTRHDTQIQKNKKEKTKNAYTQL